MQTHKDLDTRYMDALRAKAEQMTRDKQNIITAGEPGEIPLLTAEEEAFAIYRLLDDASALRISIGELKFGGHEKYLTFRGDIRSIDRLLSEAVAALRAVRVRLGIGAEDPTP